MLIIGCAGLVLAALVAFVGCVGVFKNYEHEVTLAVATLILGIVSFVIILAAL